MAGQADLSGSGSVGSSNEVRTHFSTREGVYKLVTFAEYSRPNRTIAYNPIQSVQQGGATSPGQAVNPPVRVTLVSLPSDPQGFCDRITFNHGRELYVYPFKGPRKPADLSKPIDKRVYKGTSPTCHDINRTTLSTDSVMLLVGFTGGQIQLVDPIRKEVGKLFNEERIIEKSKVTCIKWLPGSPNLFLVSHTSGQMYLYSEELTCGGPAPPTYQLFKQGAGFSVWTCKAKSTRNPLYRWVMGEGSAINAFAFSPCSKYLAVVSQDGCLRVLNYDAMELIGLATSFFGGLICVCWSPDGQLVVAGGEDDLITVWSFQQRRIVARGQGHRSWVTVVAFDSYTSSSSSSSSSSSNNSSNTPSQSEGPTMNGDAQVRKQHTPTPGAGDLVGPVTCYRLGSVAMDTQLCLWEITDDVLKQQPFVGRCRASMVSGPGSPSSSLKFSGSANSSATATATAPPTPPASVGSLTQRLANSLTFAERKAGTVDRDGTTEKSHRKNFSLGGRSSVTLTGNSSLTAKSSSSSAAAAASNASTTGQPPLTLTGPADRLRLMGTAACPRLDEVPMLEPLVCKKVSQERLTALVFREDCIVTACQDGIISTWSRPNGPGSSSHHSANEGTMV